VQPQREQSGPLSTSRPSGPWNHAWLVGSSVPSFSSSSSSFFNESMSLRPPNTCEAVIRSVTLHVFSAPILDARNMGKACRKPQRASESRRSRALNLLPSAGWGMRWHSSSCWKTRRGYVIFSSKLSNKRQSQITVMFFVQTWTVQGWKATVKVWMCH